MDNNENDSKVSVFDYIKSNFNTSAFVRKRAIRNITKSMNDPKFDANNADLIAKMANQIENLDLCDDRFGRILDQQTFEKFISVLNQNENMSELAENLSKSLVLYDKGNIEK